MAMFRMKKAVVEAVQFDPTVRPWPDGVEPWSKAFDVEFNHLGFLRTAEGRRTVCSRDWIVTLPGGVRDVLPEDEFRANYELVEES